MAGSKDDKPTQNIFQIMDQIVRQLNKTKKMFLIMIVSIIVVVPGTFIVTFALARTIVIVFVLAWIVIGIRQWFVLSKWTQRYEIYKELQKKIDEKLDYNNDNNEEKGVKE